MLVTGSKGGGGKTPLALSLALAYNEINWNVICVDLNFNNSDFFSILSGVNLLFREANNWNQLQEDMAIPYYFIAENMVLTSWDQNQRLGLSSTSEIWDYLTALIEQFREFFQNSRPSIIIADTNLTLPLLCPPLTRLQDWDELPPVEVWHIWSPSIILQLGEQARFEKAIDILKRFSKGFESRLHHVFTPRAHVPTSFFKTMKSWARGEHEVARSPRSKQILKTKVIPFDSIKSSLFAPYLVTILNESPQRQDPDWLMRTWLENIIEHLNSLGGIPKNVIIIPTMINRLALFVEDLVLKPHRTLLTMRNDLAEMYQKVKETIIQESESII